MNNRKVGSILGFTSILLVIISIIVFYALRGPNADVYLISTIFSMLSIFGILFAVVSWWMSKRLVLLIVGLLGNILVFISLKRMKEF
ncbi:hypothetical protein [Lysinibacillus sp. LZ02]|uniref:hypothetical protein n=1 Tax=Lysinibacillus sp. LZ02 TaxID=3420668 RepID=UPI003D3695A7